MFKGYNPSKICNVIIVFDDMIVDMISNRKRSPIVTELLIRDRKLNNFLVFITHYFAVSKSIRLNSKHHFIMKIPNKQMRASTNCI